MNARSLTLAPILGAALALAPVLPGSARAFTQLYRFQYCSALPQDNERLHCYDNYARELGLPPPSTDGALSATQTRHGDWTLRSETLPRDQSTTIFAFTEGRTIVMGREGRPTIPSLVARCHNGVTELYVAFGSSFPAQAGPLDQSVLYLSRETGGKAEEGVIAIPGASIAERRIRAKVTMGERRPVEIFLTRSTDGWAFFFPNPVSHLLQTMNESSITFEYTPTGHPAMRVEFGTKGMNETVTQLRNTCGW